MSSRSLRILAVCSMFIDHAAHIFLKSFSKEWYIFRGFGRIAFPIFCYLIVEGYVHTRSLPKYMGRLALFALISEIPFDLAFRGKAFDNGKCSVFVTLLLGLTAIASAGTVVKTILKKLKAADSLCESVYMQTLCALPVIVCCVRAAEKLHSDYGGAGVVMIYVLYLFREKKPMAFIALALVNSFALCMSIVPAAGFFGSWGVTMNKTIQWAAPLACLPLGFYNGKNGNMSKIRYLFYIFYPAHLLLLWAIARIVL